MIPGTVSPDGRWLAYEIRTQPEKTENSGELEVNTLPNGFPAVYFGVNLALGGIEGGEPRAICAKGPCWRGSFSPDSRQLAYYSNEDRSPTVWIYDVLSGAKRRLADIRPRLSSDRALWSPDGKTLYVMGARLSKPHAAPKSERVKVFRTHDAPPPQQDLNAALLDWEASSIVAIDVASGASRVVVPHDAELPPHVMRLSPDGKWISYFSVRSVKDPAADDYYESLVIVPAGGGKPVAVFSDIRVPDDESYDWTYQWTPDSKRIVYSKTSDLRIASLGDPSHSRRLGESLGTIAGSPLYLTRDGSAAIVGVESGEKVYDFMTPMVIAVVPLDGGAARKLDVQAVPTMWQPASGSLIAKRGREVIDVDLKTGRVKSLLNAGRFNPIGVANNMVVARFESLTTPGDYYLFDRNMKIVRRLSHVEPRLDTSTVGPMESFETTIGERRVESHVFLPAGAKRGDALPAIVYFYSGAQLSADDFGGGAPNTIPVQIFTSRGYAVLFCDVPLSPPGKGNPVQEMTDEVVAQVEHAAMLGYVDRHRVAIMGQSYGAYSAAAIVTRSDLFRAAIALDGVYDLPGTYGNDDGGGGAAWAESGQGRMGTHPWAALDRYIANSPYYQADKIHTPLLLIHGEKDSACPVLEARKMFNALKRLGRDAELAIYAGEGHVPGFWALSNSVDATGRMLAFLDAHLK
jgi:dipeptidyl aminopeptidase/acylaminoacyl peptidase